MSSPQPGPERTVGWPSVPKVLVDAIGERFDCYTATRFPGPQSPDGDVQAIVASGHGVVRITRLGGPRDRVTDQGRIAVDVIHADEALAEDLAEEIATWLVDTRPIRGAGLMLDGATVEVSPHEVPYPDPSVSQFSAIYLTSARRIEAM